ncbi:MAG: hypothetical protein EBR40_11575 [Proteobacteria bacterium]|nr:hypothetical protein [Pseudomonadota bacterium]
MLKSDTYVKVMRDAACVSRDRALDRRDRMVGMVAGKVSLDRAGIVADSILAGMDRAASGVCEGTRTGQAARVTRALEARGVACAHALDREHTGAIPAARMRARGDRPVPCGMAAPVPSQDAVLLRAEQARRVACADLRGLIPAFNRASGPGRKALLARINLILRDYAADESVRDTARSLGWKV